MWDEIVNWFLNNIIRIDETIKYYLCLFAIICAIFTFQAAIRKEKGAGESTNKKNGWRWVLFILCCSIVIMYMTLN